jgi:8-oxo-dGTP diphosphatase
MAETPRILRDPTGANSPRVGVGVLLVDERGRVLLTLRNRPPEAGCWSIVGGKVDFLESLQECAVREALEEVGVEIAIDSLLCVTDHLLPNEAQHWVSPAYLARMLRGEATNREPEKTREVRWFPPDRLPPNLTMTARNAIRAYVRRSPLECGGSPPPLTP